MEVYSDDSLGPPHPERQTVTRSGLATMYNYIRYDGLKRESDSWRVAIYESSNRPTPVTASDTTLSTETGRDTGPQGMPQHDEPAPGDQSSGPQFCGLSDRAGRGVQLVIARAKKPAWWNIRIANQCGDALSGGIQSLRCRMEWAEMSTAGAQIHWRDLIRRTERGRKAA